MEMKAKATDNVTSVKLNVIKLFTCTQLLVLEIRKNVIEIGIRVLKLIHRIKLGVLKDPRTSTTSKLRLV